MIRSCLRKRRLARRKHLRNFLAAYKVLRQLYTSKSLDRFYYAIQVKWLGDEITTERYGGRIFGYKITPKSRGWDDFSVRHISREFGRCALPLALENKALEKWEAMNV